MSTTADEITGAGACGEVCVQTSDRMAARKDLNVLKNKVNEEEKDHPFKFGFYGSRVCPTCGDNHRQSKDPRIGEVSRLKNFHKQIRELGPIFSSLREKIKSSKNEDEATDEKPSRQRLYKVTGFTEEELRNSKEFDEYISVKANREALAKSAEEYREAMYEKMEKNESKNLMEQDSRCALAAIEYYNQKHGTDYELVETLGSYRKVIIGFWFHCNFRAQLKTETKSGCRPSPKLFFAELHAIHPQITCKTCQILDGPTPKPVTVRGCGICGDQLCHPFNGFEVGWKSDQVVKHGLSSGILYSRR